VRLRRSRLQEPGIIRRRRGKAFEYRHPSGRPVGPEDRERIRHLAIPPAWRDVWICPYPNGHIQATGVDDAGRTQYLYHPQWAQSRASQKHTRVRQLARSLPTLRKAVRRDLGRTGLGRERVTAAALRLLDLGQFRSGGEQYAVENGTFGVSTLERSHVTVKDSTVRFAFPAKSGQFRDTTVDDPQLAEVVRELKRSRGGGSARLLRWRDDRGWHDLTAGDLNEALREHVGDGYTVKDLRTWAATVRAALFLAGLPTPKTKKERRAQQQEACDEVAELLGNTRAVARRSYVDPEVFEAHDDGTLHGPVVRALSAADRRRLDAGDLDALTDLAAAERALARLLVRRG
jgi:DNA topoisomerase-1